MDFGLSSTIEELPVQSVIYSPLHCICNWWEQLLKALATSQPITVKGYAFSGGAWKGNYKSGKTCTWHSADIQTEPDQTPGQAKVMLWSLWEVHIPACV